ncbi:hypothetical protein [Bradyrhizobium neotropicale]|uniref:hypothetical protein n=1 Tax=Bradyrhizobium neotropicale TaxID=1497615 RepID=UPI0007C4A6E5|nr:hypothetical protein [Bradyrhizobium neotropicale]
MSWNQSEIIGARWQILETAKRVLSGKASAIEGARIIAGCRFKAKLEDDADILPFVGIDSETDALPLGHDRIHWQAQARADLRPKIDEAQAWARDLATSPCQNLIAREAALLRWPD